MKRLVLVGGGHAHALVLRDWIQQPVPGVELVLVSPTRLAHYSGMVPGWLAGLYDFREVCIDVASLAHAAAARFVEDEVTAMDAGQRSIRLRRHDALRYDIVSLNIGSTLYPPTDRPGDWLSMRPLNRLQASWDALLARLPRDARAPRRVVAAGAGPAGVESVLAVLARLRTHQPQARWDGLLLSRDDVLPTHAPAVRRAARRVLAAAGVQVQTGVDALAFEPRDTDLVLWATGAQAHRWPSQSDLACDTQGFVRIDPTLRSTSHPNVFAVGDCASWSTTPLPKAGVIPVRQGPVLTRNLRAALTGRGDDATLEPYRPQHRHLALLATGDGRAIASWGPLTATGAWVWRWKDHIDRRFMRSLGTTQVKVA